MVLSFTVLTELLFSFVAIFPDPVPQWNFLLSQTLMIPTQSSVQTQPVVSHLKATYPDPVTEAKHSQARNSYQRRQTE